jgi:hypothetical protein
MVAVPMSDLSAMPAPLPCKFFIYLSSLAILAHGARAAE